MNKLKALILSAAFAIAAAGMPAPAAAQSPGCTLTAGPLVLERPVLGASGSQYTGCIQRALEKISTTTASAFDVAAATNAIAISTASLQVQVDDLGISTGALAISTGSLQLQVDTLGISTGALAISTASLQLQVDSLGISTDAISVSTGALAISTAALELNKLARDGSQTMTGPFTLGSSSITISSSALIGGDVNLGGDFNLTAGAPRITAIGDTNLRMRAGASLLNVIDHDDDSTIRTFDVSKDSAETLLFRIHESGEVNVGLETARATFTPTGILQIPASGNIFLSDPFTGGIIDMDGGGNMLMATNSNANTSLGIAGVGVLSLDPTAWFPISDGSRTLGKAGTNRWTSLHIGAGLSTFEGAVSSMVIQAGFIGFHDSDVAGVNGVGSVSTGNNNMTIAAASNRDIDFQDTTGVKMKLQHGGNVGIGVTPGAKLDIKSASVASEVVRVIESGSSERAVTLIEGSGGEGEVAVYGTGNTVDSKIDGANDSYIGAISGANFAIGTNTPENKLHVTGGDAQFDSDLAVGTDTMRLLGAPGTDRTITVWSSLVNRPGQLELGGHAGTTDDVNIGNISFLNTDNATGDSCVANINGETDGTNLGGKLEFFTKSDGAGSCSPKMTVRENGSVGIGTTAPQSKLNVHAGDIIISTGSVKAGGSGVITVEAWSSNSVGQMRVNSDGANPVTVNYFRSGVQKYSMGLSTNDIFLFRPFGGEKTRIGSIEDTVANPPSTLVEVNDLTIGFGVDKSTILASPELTDYAIDASSGIRIGNDSCFTFSDGSVQCEAAGIGGGDVVEAGNNNFTGDNTSAGEWTNQSGSSTNFNGNEFGIYNIVQSSGDVSNQTTAGSAPVDLVGSTTTITIQDQARVRITFSGQGENVNATSGCIVTASQDGAGVESQPASGTCAVAASDGEQCTFSFVTAPLAGGDQTFYMTFQRTGLAGTCVMHEDSQSWTFMLEEIR